MRGRCRCNRASPIQPERFGDVDAHAADRMPKVGGELRLISEDSCRSGRKHRKHAALQRQCLLGGGAESGPDLIIDDNLLGRQSGIIQPTGDVACRMPAAEMEQFAARMLPCGK